MVEVSVKAGQLQPSGPPLFLCHADILSMDVSGFRGRSNARFAHLLWHGFGACVAELTIDDYKQLQPALGRLHVRFNQKL